ncbi:MAG: prolyl oligopeptidase family serine peptidase [Planctomycetota bacterium]
MRKLLVAGSAASFAALALGGSASGQSGSSAPPRTQEAAFTPPAAPVTPKGDQHDDYHGTRVADPYRWLEQLGAPAVDAWIAEQNKVATPYLEALPDRAAIAERLQKLWNFERYGVPTLRGGRYFYSFNPGLANHSVLMVSDAIDAEPRVLINPNTFSADGTVSLAGQSISPDGSLIAYAKSDGGSDWRDWFFRRVDDGEDLDDRLSFMKFGSLSWARDGSGVYYSRYPAGPDGAGDDAQPTSVFFHRLGAPQSEDVLVHDVSTMARHRGLRPNTNARATEDGRYVVLNVRAGYHENQVHVLDLQDPDGTPRPVVGAWSAQFSFVGNDGTQFFFETTDGAPKSRIVAIDVDSPERAKWREVVPEDDDPLRGVSFVGGRLIATYLHDVKTRVRVFGTDGSVERDIELPGVGSARGFGGESGQTTTFYSFTSFATPTEVWAYDIPTGESTLFKRPSVPFDPEQFVTEQVWYASRDGTRVPMFVTCRRDLARDGKRPTLLYGYGGFNVSLTPSYSTVRMVWLERGGVLAIPNLRGGGEFGKEWHLAGTRDRKQNVFDDFIAAAEWLIESGYTSREHLGIQGGSNGGLLVGACMTQRPDLFGACLPAVGVLDMLRYHRASANARNWSTDYGLSENAEDFASQYAYSPVHNARAACYPPTLVTTADHDDRVVPWHSYKFAAAVQSAQGCDNPVLLHVETRAGHGAGKPTWMQIEHAANALAFLSEHTKDSP